MYTISPSNNSSPFLKSMENNIDIMPKHYIQNGTRTGPNKIGPIVFHRNHKQSF